jgi:integrase
MKVFKRGGEHWHYKFMYKGQYYFGSTGLTKKGEAETYVGEIRKQIVMGNIGIIEKTPAPTLKRFLEDSFIPFAEGKHKDKPKTFQYYKYGAWQLIEFRELAGTHIDEITDEHSAKYIAAHHGMSPSSINQGLRTLRRALRCAFKWKRLDRQPVIPLMPGERQRCRVITEEEERRYLDACMEPWATMATIMIELGPRPSEILVMRCENVHWEISQINFPTGKSKAAKRELPITDRVYERLFQWWDAIGRPTAGFMFPGIGTGACHAGRAKENKRGGSARRTNEGMYRASRRVAGPISRPFSSQWCVQWHHAALEASGLAAGEEGMGESFVPYHLRHSALTRLAANCPNPYAVAAAAGHSSISMTMKYVHPQKSEIWQAFERKSGSKIGTSRRRQMMKVVGHDQGDAD